MTKSIIITLVCCLGFSSDALCANVTYNENVMHATFLLAPSLIDRIRAINPAVADAYLANHENEASSLNILDCLSEIRFHYADGNLRLVREFADLMYQRFENIHDFRNRIGQDIQTRTQDEANAAINEIFASMDYCRDEVERYIADVYTYGEMRHAPCYFHPSFVGKIRTISPSVADAYMADHSTNGCSLNILDCVSEIQLWRAQMANHVAQDTLDSFTQLINERFDNIENFISRIESGAIATEPEEVRRNVIREIRASVGYCKRVILRYIR